MNYCSEGFIGHRPPGDHPRIRLALPSSGVDFGIDSTSIQHRFDIDSTSISCLTPISMSNRCRIAMPESAPEEGRARRIRAWGRGGLCLINPSRMNYCVTVRHFLRPFVLRPQYPSLDRRAMQRFPRSSPEVPWTFPEATGHSGRQPLSLGILTHPDDSYTAAL